MKPVCAIRVVSTSELSVVWKRIAPRVRDILTMMIDIPWVTPESILESLRLEKSFLLLFDGRDGEYGAIISFQDMPTYKVGRVLFVFGSGMDSGDIKVFHQWMKMRGCKYVDATVRTESRRRLFGRFGYRYEYTALRKEL